MSTFLHLVHEDLLDTALVVVGHITREHFLRLARVFQALVVVVHEQDQLVLVVDDSLLVVDHLDRL